MDKLISKFENKTHSKNQQSLGISSSKFGSSDQTWPNNFHQVFDKSNYQSCPPVRQTKQRGNWKNQNKHRFNSISTNHQTGHQDSNISKIGQQFLNDQSVHNQITIKPQTLVINYVKNDSYKNDSKGFSHSSASLDIDHQLKQSRVNQDDIKKLIDEINQSQARPSKTRKANTSSVYSDFGSENAFVSPDKHRVQFISSQAQQETTEQSENVNVANEEIECKNFTGKLDQFWSAKEIADFMNQQQQPQNYTTESQNIINQGYDNLQQIQELNEEYQRSFSKTERKRDELSKHSLEESPVYEEFPNQHLYNSGASIEQYELNENLENSSEEINGGGFSTENEVMRPGNIVSSKGTFELQPTQCQPQSRADCDYLRDYVQETVEPAVGEENFDFVRPSHLKVQMVKNNFKQNPKRNSLFFFFCSQLNCSCAAQPQISQEK